MQNTSNISLMLHNKEVIKMQDASRFYSLHCFELDVFNICSLESVIYNIKLFIKIF